MAHPKILSECKTKIRSKLTLLLLALLPILGFVYLRHELSLRREDPSRFLKVRGTEGAYYIAGSMWSSPNTVVCFFPNRQGTPSHLIMEVDARTGKRRLLKKLTTLFAKADSPWYFDTSVSPNGKWLLWPGGMSGWKAATLDGSRLIQRPRGSDNLSNLHVAWLPDSSGWVECHSKIGSPLSFIQTCLIGSPTVKDVSFDRRGIYGDDLWTTPQGDVIVGGAGGADSGKLLHLSLFKKGMPSTTSSASFADDQMRTYFDCEVSPQGDRVAWLYQINRMGQTFANVWVSDFDGNNMKRVTPDLVWNQSAPTYLHWKPDGKRISYWRYNALWETPVD